MFARYLIILALIGFSARLQAYQLPVEIFEYIDDVKIVAFIDMKDLQAAKSFKGFGTSPPLSIAGALSALEKHIAVHQPEISGARLEEIALRRIPHHSAYWHYAVKLKNGNPKTPYHYFVILMSGKVIPAVHEIAAVK